MWKRIQILIFWLSSKKIGASRRIRVKKILRCFALDIDIGIIVKSFYIGGGKQEELRGKYCPRNLRRARRSVDAKKVCARKGLWRQVQNLKFDLLVRYMCVLERERSLWCLKFCYVFGHFFLRHCLKRPLWAQALISKHVPEGVSGDTLDGSHVRKTCVFWNDVCEQDPSSDTHNHTFAWLHVEQLHARRFVYPVVECTLLGWIEWGRSTRT